MTSRNNNANLRCNIKLCASFEIHRSIRLKIADFLSCVTLKFDGWPWKIIGHLFYTTLSFVQYFKAIGIFKLELQSGNPQFGSKLATFLSRVTLKIDEWPWKNKAPRLYNIKLCASFEIHLWSQTWDTVRKRSIRVKIGDFWSRVTWKFDGWPWNTIRHHFYAALSFVLHFKSIGIFKLE